MTIPLCRELRGIFNFRCRLAGYPKKASSNNPTPYFAFHPCYFHVSDSMSLKLWENVYLIKIKANYRQ